MAEAELRLLHDLGERVSAPHEPAHRVALVLGERGPELIVKQRAADARRLAARLAGVDALSAGLDGAVRAWSGPRDLGVLTRDVPLKREPVALVISRGGPARAHFWPHEVVARWPVTVRVPQPGGNARGGESEAAETLLRFVAPLRPDEMPVPMAAEVLRMASTVWSGVVLADREGLPERLRQAREAVCQRGAPEGLVDLLVERKRQAFARDRRILAVDAVERHGGRTRVVVHAVVAD